MADILIFSQPLLPFPMHRALPRLGITAAPPRPRPLSRRRTKPARQAGPRQQGRPSTVPVFTAIRSPEEEGSVRAVVQASSKRRDPGATAEHPV